MKQFDIVLFGATSFVGQIVARYLHSISSVASAVDENRISWAIAGRSATKLQQLKQSLGEDANDLQLIIADAQQPSQLDALCAQAKVVISTVGPYALFGEPMLKACVSTGTDYCDLTGEPHWIANMLSRYENIAKITGARIIHSCGFDSVPSDLGVYFTQKCVSEKIGNTCDHVSMRVKSVKGAASGGTVASVMNLIKEATTNQQVRKLLADPFALCSQGHGFNTKQKDIKLAEYDPIAQQWIAPFIMAAINTRIVHRSNACLNNFYGQNFRYDEAMMMGDGIKGSIYSSALSAGLGTFMVAAAVPPTRWAMEKFLLPKPGQGPSEKTQKQGHYDLRFFALSANNILVKTQVTGDQDPGYGSTAKILSQSAICMVKELDKKQLPGGFWTPTSALGNRLIARLQRYAGLTFEIC